MEKINYSYFFNTNSNLSSVEKLLMLDEFYQEFCLECDLYDICQTCSAIELNCQVNLPEENGKFFCEDYI